MAGRRGSAVQRVLTPVGKERRRARLIENEEASRGSPSSSARVAGRLGRRRIRRLRLRPGPGKALHPRAQAYRSACWSGAVLGGQLGGGDGLAGEPDGRGRD